MATAFRSKQDVTNGTAGTSVIVSKPAGIVDTGANPGRDMLIAFIAATGNPTITKPSGWNLITTVTGSTGVIIAAYWKLASSEPSNWTWTLGSSQRNWGFVGAYTGVDPTSPVADFATVNTLTGNTLDFRSGVTHLASLPPWGQGVSGGAVVRTATGSATTWTTTSTERSDLSTNGGSGTDIAGEVGDSQQSSDLLGALYEPVLTASQSQTNGAAIALTLTPYFVLYDGNKLGVSLQAALGQDPDGDLSAASWTTVRAMENAAVQLRVGSPNGTSSADPMSMSFTLLNVNGEWTKPTGTYSRYFVRNLPFRLILTGFGVNPNGHHRATAFLSSAKVRWDKSLKASVVDVTAAGRLRRMQRNTPPLHSAGYRSALKPSTFDAVTAIEHWSFEDGTEATSIANSVPGHSTATLSNAQLSSSSVFVSSQALPVLSGTSVMYAGVTPYTDTANMWYLAAAVSVPAEPVGSITLLQISTTGTAATWAVGITPGTSAVTLNVTSSTGASLLSTSAGFFEPDIYGHPTVIVLAVAKNGTGVDYDLELVYVTGGTGTDMISVPLTGTIASSTQGTVKSFFFPAQGDLSGTTFGQLALYKAAPPTGATASGGSTYLVTTVARAMILGHAGEVPSARFNRLCDEEGVPNDTQSSGSSVLTMGPQGTDTLIGLLREAETVEGNMMHDAGIDAITGATGVLFFPARDLRDNATTALTLDFSQLQIVGDFEPTLDDLSVINDAEASRPSGSKFRELDQASIDLEGDYSTQVTANTETDASLRDIAGRLVGEGTVDGLRYAAVGFNLRRSPTLAQAWFGAGLNAKLDITHPPSQYPPDTIESFIEGYTETISNWHWEVTCNLSPADTNKVMELTQTSGDVSALAGHLDADSCVLAEDLDTTETDVDVYVVPPATTTADDFPFDMFIGAGLARERVTVSNATSAVVDAFGRTTSNGWGTADVGGAWTTSGGAAADFSVGSGVGSISQNTVGASRFVTLPNQYTDIDATVTFTVPAVALTQPINMYLLGRFANTSAYYSLLASFDTSGNVDLSLTNVNATLGSASNVVAYGAGTSVRVRLQIIGTTLRARIWLAAGSQPSTWNLEITDTTYSSGAIGVRAILVTGNTNVSPVVVTSDDLVLSFPQTLTVTRSVNGVVLAHAIGDPLTLIPVLRCAM